MPLPNTFDEMNESRYLRKEECGTNGLIVTCATWTKENLAKEDEEPEIKWILHFQEDVKPMVCGPTNRQLLRMALNINGPAEAIGKKICVYNDPSVSFGGKITGGIRIKAVGTTSGTDEVAKLKAELAKLKSQDKPVVDDLDGPVPF